MSRLILAAMAMLIVLPASAQTPSPARDCAPGNQMSGTTDCNKPENKQTEVKPPMPSTNMKETVIPKAGAQQTPDSTPTTAVRK